MTVKVVATTFFNFTYIIFHFCVYLCTFFFFIVFNFVIAGEEGANSAGSSSLDGFLLNGIPNSLDLGDTTSKDFTPKSLMLADLLEKNIERREPPSLNGALRLVERGLELVHSGAQTAAGQMNGAVTMSMKSQNNTLSNTTATSNQDLKRPNTCAVNDVPLAKKVHLNGDVKTKEPPEEGMSLFNEF